MIVMIGDMNIISQRGKKEYNVDLYQHIPSPVHPIPEGVYPFPIKDSIPEDDEISWEAPRLRLNRTGRPSVIQSERLHQWLHEATKDEMPDTTNCQKVVAIVKAEFFDWMLANYNTC